MQEYNSIYKFDVEQSDLVVVKAANIIPLGENLKKSFSFRLKTAKDLKVLLSNSTQLFHQDYFRLRGNPLIVVQTTSLENLFLKEIHDLGFGNFTVINLETNNEIVSYEPSQNHFNKWYNEGNDVVI